MKKTNENGITLIALVVTIVVLLILAGITITYVMADGGIFDSAKTAASSTIKSQISDYASQIQATYMTQDAVKSATGIAPTPSEKDLTGTSISKEQVENFFPKITGDKGYTIGTPNELKGTNGKVTGSFTVTYQGKTYTVTFNEGVPEVSDPT